MLHSPDSTLTVENVVGVMEKVTDDGRVNFWSQLIGGNLLADITSECSNKKETLHISSDMYVNCCVDSSWEDLARGLYYTLETAAVEEVRSYLNPRGRLLQWVWFVVEHSANTMSFVVSSLLW